MTALVTRAVRSWASSKTTTSCSGMMPWRSKESIASSAWFVTTTSTSRATSRLRSAKQSWIIGQEVPMHWFPVTDT